MSIDHAESRWNRLSAVSMVLLTAALMALALPAVISASDDTGGRTLVRVQQPKSSEDGTTIKEAFEPASVTPPRRVPLYPRAEPFWTFETGPAYGRVPSNLGRSPDVLILRVGSFITKGSGLPIPEALRTAEEPKGIAYYLVQFTSAAAADPGIVRSLEELATLGAVPIEHVPNNGWVVRLDPSCYDAIRVSPLLQYIGRYQPAWKIAPDIGTAPLPDPEKAASPVYSLRVLGWPGTTGADVAAAVAVLGGTVTYSTDDPTGGFVLADLHKSKIAALAHFEAVRLIEENLPRFACNEESSWNVTSGAYLIGQKPPLFLAGIDGSGRYVKDVDNAPTGNFPNAEDKDWNGNGIIDNAAQLIADTDTGMAVDGGDFAETSSSSGWTGWGGSFGPNVPRIGNVKVCVGGANAGYSCTADTDCGRYCILGPKPGQPCTANSDCTPGTCGAAGGTCTGSAGANAGANHRKVAWYEVAPGGFGTGDLASCDPGRSHGTMTSGQTAGNASNGPFLSDGIDWTGDGTPDDFGDPKAGDLCGPGFCFTGLTGGTTTFRVEGAAPGARIVFQDVYSKCPDPDSIVFGNYGTLLADARAKGARLHVYTYGVFNESGEGTTYDSSSLAIDDFLSTDSNRDFMLFIAAGNRGSGSKATAYLPTAQTLVNEAASKNACVVGANLSGNEVALQSRYAYSSVGPAPSAADASCPQGTGGEPAASNCYRVKPDVMAPGQDGNAGLPDAYNCVSGDADQVGTVQCLQLASNTGTSFAAPNAAGAGALIRDYFASGFYPDGTSSNAGNDADRVPRMSGAMVKTLLICSAEHMDGGGLNNAAHVPNYDHRYNHEQGYGYINLRNVLPVTIDASSVSGLIVKDGGCPNGVTGCPDSLTAMTSPLSVGGSTTAEFEVLSRDEELRVALGWVEPTNAVGDLRNNLNLELRYCGPDRDCTRAGGRCVIGGAACASDSACSGAGNACDMDRVWYGNVFSEDPNDDGLEEQDLDGTPGLQAKGVLGHWRSEGAWSLPNLDANCDGTEGSGEAIAMRDIRNNTEGIFLSPDPEADGTAAADNADNQLFPGKWRVTVANASGSIDAQKYTLCIAGPVAIDSSIRLNRNPISCSGEVAVIVNEVAKPGAIDPDCTAALCQDTAIEPRVTVQVRTPAGALADEEKAPDLVRDPGSLNFKSAQIPVSTGAATNVRDGVLFAADGYTVTAIYNDRDCSADGTAGCATEPADIARETVQKSSRSVFACQPKVDFTAIGQPGRNAPFLLAGGCDDDKYFDRLETFTYLIQFANLDGVTLEDVTVTLRAVTPDSNNATDPGRLDNGASPYVQVRSGSVLIGRVFPDFVETAGFTVAVTSVPAWDASPLPPPEVEMVVGISSQKAGKNAPAYGVFKHILNADDETFLYSTDYPTGATVDRDINSDERIDNPIVDQRHRFPQGAQRNNYDKLYETITFSDLTTAAYGGGNGASFNGPWDFDSDDEGFRSGVYLGSKGNTSEITNWGEDQDYDGTLDGATFCKLTPGTACTCSGGIYPCGSGTPRTGSSCPSSDRCLTQEDFDSDQDGTLDENWGLGGGCGFLSSSGSNRGVWHTGTIGTVGAATCSSNTFSASVACENIDVIPGNTGANLWMEFLRTPVLQKVHKNADPRGLNYRVELVDWRWNLNADIQGWNAALTWEWDQDTSTVEPVDLGDGTILTIDNQGFGPISGSNVNYIAGFPMFVENDPDDDQAGFGQKKVFGCTSGPNLNAACNCAQGKVQCIDATNCDPGNTCGIIQNGMNGNNRKSDRGCMFENLTMAQADPGRYLLREPKPVDDDCDNDLANLGADGCPGYCGVDDDGDGVADNIEEACPCYGRPNKVDEDGDFRTDEPDELQRFYRCKLNTSLYCRETGPVSGGVAADDCPVGQGPCGRYGSGKPRPYGDDSCGDGKVDESSSDKWASETVLGENGHRIAQNQNMHIGSVGGPFLRYGTLEDVYDREAGNSFQGAIGFILYEGTPSYPATNTYGAAIDDMTVEWSESHPIEQASAAGCGDKTCVAGPRAGKLCFNDDDCGSGQTCSGTIAGGTSCAALSWGSTNLYAGSGIVSLNLVDFNAQTTQGNFNCTRYGFSGTGCGGGDCASSNDCDNDGLKEVEVELKTPAEPNPEYARLEQTGVGTSAYTGSVSISSSINAAGDGVAFIQYNGMLTPSVSAVYFDRDAGGGDYNRDGTIDGPPNNGKDQCPGFCATDDDQDADGTDNRPGTAYFDDDGNGACDDNSSNVGAPCTVNSNCTGGGVCLNLDEVDELCGRVCTAGATSGHCSAGATNAGTVCEVGGSATCTGTGAVCVADNCLKNTDCGTSGNCPGTCRNSPTVADGTACNKLSDCPGGYCKGTQRGDDNCAKIDEADERCAIVGGILAAGIDDNCGCVDNPITAVLNAIFDVADIIVQDYTLVDGSADGTGDGDGFADDNELVSVTLKLRNLSSFDVDGVRARLTTQDGVIACINDPISYYGRINSLQNVTNGSDALKFTVGSVSRGLLGEVKQATFVVTVTGSAILPGGQRVPFEGTATPQKLTIDLDLDPVSTPAAATTTKNFSFEARAGFGNYTSDAAWNADWGHMAFTDQAGLHCQYNSPGNPNARSAPIGCFLRQDSGTAVPDDWHLHSVVHSGGIPDPGRDSGQAGICSGGSAPGGVCTGDEGCPGRCHYQAVPWNQLCSTNTDCVGACSLLPSIQCVADMACGAQGAGTCTNPRPGTCSEPYPGTCGGQGQASMHMGLHEGTGTLGDTIHLNNIFTAWYKQPIQVGLGRPGTDDRPQLDFWQQAAVMDDRITDGSPPQAYDACIVQVLVDRDGDGIQDIGPPTDSSKDGWWEKIQPWYGVPAQQRFPIGNCTYDPNDDGNLEGDLFESGNPTYVFSSAGTQVGPSSTCFPEFIWACAGDTQDPPYDVSLSQVEPSALCFPEVDPAGDYIVREGTGPGRWVQAKFDLYRYRGRQIWVRWLTTHSQWGFPTITAGFGSPQGGNRDDGWYIDDINFRGLNATAFALKADTDTPPTRSCPASNCTTITPRLSGCTYVTRTNAQDDDVDGTIDESDEGRYGATMSDAPSRNIDLDGLDPAGPTTSDCLNGVLQFRFWVDTNGNSVADPAEIFRDWSEDPHATANSLTTETIRMNVRCSAPAPNGCAGTAQATLLVTVGVLDDDTICFGGCKSNPVQTCAGAPNVNRSACLEWKGWPALKYHVASTRVNVAASTNTWTGTGGIFDTMTCRAGTAVSCVDSDADTKCEFNTTTLDEPTTTLVSIWLVREDNGSWNELGSCKRQAEPPNTCVPYSRDTDMLNATPVCP